MNPGNLFLKQSTQVLRLVLAISDASSVTAAEDRCYLMAARDKECWIDGEKLKKLPIRKYLSRVAVTALSQENRV